LIKDDFERNLDRLFFKKDFEIAHTLIIKKDLLLEILNNYTKDSSNMINDFDIFQQINNLEII